MKLAEYNTVADISMKSEHWCFECETESYHTDDGKEQDIGLIYTKDLNTYLTFDLPTHGTSKERLMVCDGCIDMFVGNQSLIGYESVPLEYTIDDLDKDMNYITIKDTKW
tara:strand:- start:971 stop:1300 length:330 start_codon:yes stop_codon:yes gene_type:complete